MCKHGFVSVIAAIPVEYLAMENNLCLAKPYLIPLMFD